MQICKVKIGIFMYIYNIIKLSYKSHIHVCFIHEYDFIYGTVY